MKRVLKTIGYVAAGLAAVILLATGGALGWRFHRQNQIAQALELNGPAAIRDARYVMIGGVKQWISIRGENRANPVILFVHGGPGDGQSGQAATFRRWEHDFTIVQWDQRGAGLTFAAGAQLTNDIPMTRMVNDGVEVAEYVRRTLGVSRMVLLGHSWGSVLGVHMVKARPDLFSAYVGTGQVMRASDWFLRTYDDTLARAKAAHNDRDEKTLRSIGRPPYASPEGLSRLLQTRKHYFSPSDAQFTGLGSHSEVATMITSPDLSLGQVIASMQAGSLNIYPPLAIADLPALGCDFPIPFFIIEGDDDRITYSQEAKRYFDCVQAPHKALIWLAGGHFAVMTNPAAFRDALLSRVRPVASDWERRSLN